MGDTRFPTGDTIFEERYALLLRIPKSQLDWVLYTFDGLMESAALESTWWTNGETTTAEAAALFQKILDEAEFMLWTVGMVIWHASPTLLGEPWAYCDGTVVNRADLPELFTAIGTTYNTGGESGSQFRLPDLRGRVLAGQDDGAGRITTSWNNTLGGSGGEEEHTLITSETPAHSHTDLGHSHTDLPALPNITTVGPGAPQPTAVPGVGVTGVGSANLSNTGGGSAHNNLQPTLIMRAYILAKV